MDGEPLELRGVDTLRLVVWTVLLLFGLGVIAGVWLVVSRIW